MNLRDKLRAVGGSSGSGQQRGVETGNRDCRHLAVYRPLEEFPGALELSRETVARMSAVDLPEVFDPRRILYLDTETTGLGGSGTVAFLVGLGYLTDNGFEVHQFLMRDYDEEPYLLRHVEAGLNRFDMICTFNGITFDVPLLESRLLMNRMRRNCLEKPHLDLLHVARRLWKRRLGRCNLGRLEALVLGKPRVDDLPGSEVPQRYFDYLRTRREELLQDVLTHNAQDIMSLCVLLTHMAGMYEHPEKIRYSEDVYSLGRALERFDHPEEARKCYRLATRGRMGPEAYTALAYSYRRAGERTRAAEIWQEMIAARRGGVQPYVELAKYQEHVRKDCRAALELTEKALLLLSETSLESIRENGTVQETRNELQYRRRRLKKWLEAREKDIPEEALREEKKETEGQNGTWNHVQGQQGLSDTEERK